MTIRSDVLHLTSGGTATQSITPSTDAPSWQAGDVAHAVMTHTNNSALTLPTGWTLAEIENPNAFLGVAWAYKILTTADLTTTHTFTFATSDDFMLLGFADPDLDTSGDPFDASVPAALAETGTGPYTLTGPALTTVAAATRIYTALAARWGTLAANEVFTWQQGVTPVGTAGNHSSKSNAVSVALIDVTSQGTYGGYAASITDSATNLAGIAVSFKTPGAPAPTVEGWVVGTVMWGK